MLLIANLGASRGSLTSNGGGISGYIGLASKGCIGAFPANFGNSLGGGKIGCRTGLLGFWALFMIPASQSKSPPQPNSIACICEILSQGPHFGTLRKQDVLFRGP